MNEVTIGNKRFIERYQVIQFPVIVSAANELLQQQRIQFPGVAPFLLKGLVRTTIKSGVGDVTSTARFSFAFGNSDGNINYTVPAVGQSSGRVVDVNLFGNGQFPGMIIPFPLFAANGTFNYEVQDLATVAAPYTIYVGLIGSILIAA